MIVEVADTGPGIAPGDLPHVFERSYLWAKAQSHQPVGTGLGLAIVRDLAVALGGRVEVASVVGSGTTFSLHLPRSATGTESPRGPATPAPPASP